jgi:peptide/nickel transport system substrate-binding protein
VKRFTRRSFLRASAAAAAGAVIVACQPQTVVVKETVQVEKEVEKIVKETVVVEKEKEVTKVVEKQIEKIVTATPLPASEYNQAPKLAGLAQAGQLSPIEERLPPSPVVTQVTREIGKYGGVAFGEGIDPRVTHDMQIVNTTGLLDWNNDLTEAIPLLAAGYEFNEEHTRCTVYLRAGLKWSDGVPYTADDILFYFEDMQFDKDYAPSTSRYWTPGGEVMGVTKVDDFTVQFDFAMPYPCFPIIHKYSGPLRPWLPRHYFEALHPKYNPKADEEAKAEGFNNWQAKFGKHASWDYGEMEPACPLLNPWVTTKNTTSHQYYDRNPYYFEVDTEGNQLPYIDGWQVEIAQNLEIFNTRAMSGDLTIAGLNLLLVNYPLLKENEEAGNYHLQMVFAELGADVALAFNQIHPDPVLAEIFRDVRFRQAMSVAINRPEINELVFLGLGTPRQATVHHTASFFQQKWADAYAQYDPDLANTLLDEMGLDQKGPEGVRLRPDGKPLTFLLEYIPQEGPKKEVCELVVKHWAAVGVKADPYPREKDYLATRQAAQEQDCTGWMVDRQLERAAWVEGWVGSKLGPGGSSGVTYASQWKSWLQSGGQSGVEPPNEAKGLVAAFDEWQLYGTGTPEYTAAAIKVHDLIAEVLYIIGVIGEGPTPVVVSNDLENVFPDEFHSGDEKFWWGASEWFLLPTHAEQWFLKNA